MMKGTDTLAYSVFEQLFKENYKMLENLAYFYVRDREVARDIVSQSFMTLWEKRDNIAHDGIMGYVFTTIKNNCLNYRRDTQLHKAAHDYILSREQRMMEHYSATIERFGPSDLFASDIISICRHSLESMPDETREIYIHSRVHGLTYSQIADLMDISVRKVERHILKALALLRISLSDYLDFVILILASAYSCVL